MTQTMQSGLAAPASILALDGGGTYTRALIITREGQITAHAEGPGCNPFDRPDWADSLRALLERLPRHGLIAAGLGMAGYDAERPSCMAQENLVRAILGPDVALCLENDVETAHRGAFAGGPGLFLLAGTGSVVMARTTEGRSARAGGWGWLLGDEGGGYWIGRKALGYATRYLDDPSVPFAAFAQALLLSLNLPTTGPTAPDALREWLRTRTHPRSAVGDVAATVHTLAQNKETYAIALLRSAGGHLSEPPHSTAKQVSNLPPSPLPLVSCSGCYLTLNPISLLTGTCLFCTNTPPYTLPHLGGAGLKAAELAGWHSDATWICQLARNLTHGKAIA